MKTFFLITTLLLSSFFSHAAYSAQKPQAGFVIVDRDSFPFYKHSKLIEQNESPTLSLKKEPAAAYAIVVKLLDNMKIPYLLISESPAIFQTDWISWHYDNESKQTLSTPDNRFFNMETRDKYKFKIAINPHQQQSHISFSKVEREQEEDITPDSAMSWFKWVQKDPSQKAVKAFMRRLQTEYEIYGIAPNEPVTEKSVIQDVVQKRSNRINLAIGIDQAWAKLNKQLKQNDIQLGDVHDNQHMLNTKWVYAEFMVKSSHLKTTSKQYQRHKFQLMVIPGASAESSTVMVFHTGFQQNTETVAWGDNSTQEAIAAAFLDLLELE